MGEPPASQTGQGDGIGDAIEVQVQDMAATPNGVSVVLKSGDSDQAIYMMIGLSEGEAIARALEHVEMTRPMTHDLMKTMLDRLGWSVRRVLIRAVKGNSYLADLVLEKGSDTMVLDARPSDAIALAVRTDAKIYVNRSVFDEQQIRTSPNQRQPKDQPQGSSPEGSSPQGSSKDKPNDEAPSSENGMHL
jgi:bifunctional DNase/RNase